MQPGQVPYRFGAPADPPRFCDREAHLNVANNRMRSGIHVIVPSPRRCEKTSLLRAADTVERNGTQTAYANLLLATTEVDLASLVVEAVVRCDVGPVGRRRHSLEETLRHLRATPRVTFGADATVSIGLAPAVVGSSWVEVMTHVTGLLEGSSGRRSVALILDELQVVAGIGGHSIGGAFQALVDTARHISLVFSGSHLAIMERLIKETVSHCTAWGSASSSPLSPSRQW